MTSAQKAWCYARFDWLISIAKPIKLRVTSSSPRLMSSRKVQVREWEKPTFFRFDRFVLLFCPVFPWSYGLKLHEPTWSVLSGSCFTVVRRFDVHAKAYGNGIKPTGSAKYGRCSTNNNHSTEIYESQNWKQMRKLMKQKRSLIFNFVEHTFSWRTLALAIDAYQGI